NSDMGKWARVECTCPNRRPLPGSDPVSDLPHRRRGRRLSRTQRREQEEWERTLCDMYECGHPGGNVIQLWPGDIIRLGRILGKVFGAKELFPIFTIACDPQSYDGELLEISTEQARLWLLEVESLRRALAGEGNLPFDTVQTLMAEFHSYELGILENLDQ